MFFAACATALVLLAQPNPALEAAQKAVAELRYPDARPLLARARLTPNLDRPTLLEILWLQGLVSVSLGQGDSARQAFRTLLSIEPEYMPAKEQPPKVMTPFYEARGWVATKGPLKLTPLPPEREGGRVKRIGFTISSDPLGLVMGVRLHVEGESNTHADLLKLKATRDVDAAEVSWWAELIGERDAVLEVLGSVEHPIVDKGVDVQDLPVTPPQPPVVIQEPAPRPPLRTYAYVAFGVGGLSLVGGAVFAGLAASLTAQLKGVMRDASGAVTSLTQVQAFALNAQERTDAMLANTLLVAGGLLLALGLALFLAGGS